MEVCRLSFVRLLTKKQTEVIRLQTALADLPIYVQKLLKFKTNIVADSVANPDPVGSV